MKEEEVFLLKHGAKNFANGYAAVCAVNGRWGFINNKSKQIIDYGYRETY